MTAQELVDGLRERGYTVRRSTEPAWVIIPWLKPDDPICEFLGKKGAIMRPFQPEQHSRPELRAYEAVLQPIRVEVPELEGETENETNARRRQAIWEAAAPAPHLRLA